MFTRPKMGMRQTAVMTMMVFFGSQLSVQGKNFQGASLIDYAGYSNCIMLENENTRVILDPNCGGRILEYSYNRQNVIWLDPEQDGWVYKSGGPEIYPCGGSFDIGPEMIIPKHPDLWLGRWKAGITGSRTARMTSPEDGATGVQLTREFELDKKTSHLRCTQIIKNTSREIKHWCHWGRTIAVGGGICVVPLNPESRFPEGYVIYGPGPILDYQPEKHPNVKVSEGFLEITGPPPQPKFGMDSYAGWLSYLTPNNLMFIKKFPVYPDRIYSEMAAITVAVYYLKNIRCELEPIGPRETIKPGCSVSFTEDWWLLPYEYPKNRESALKTLTEIVNRNTK